MFANFPLHISIRKPKQDPAFVFQSVFTRKINELAERSAEMLQTEIKRQIETKRLVSTAELLNSVTTSVQDSRSGKLITASSDKLQARVVEYGAKPHGAFNGRGPAGSNTQSEFIARIMIWMNHKGIEGGKPSAFRIARAIAIKGIPSSVSFPLRHPFTNAQRNTRRAIQKMWQVELDKAIARLNSSSNAY